MSGQTVLVIGGAGFIGSNLIDRLRSDDPGMEIRVFDNFSSGQLWHIEKHLKSPRFCLIEGEAKDTESLLAAMNGVDTVIHLASNPDIARAAVEPDIDFWSGSALTQSVLEAMRRSNAKVILYVSGSGVYGDLGEEEGVEDRISLRPVSPYAASKIAGEAMVSAYIDMFGMRGATFRFGNVVGPRQTHGVGFDFLRALRRDPRRLRILGDGQQSKSYIHVDDVTEAVLTVSRQLGAGQYSVFNVATGDYITVEEIARIAVGVMGLDPAAVKFELTGGRAGWKGDVPVVRLNTDRIRSLGWANRLNARQAIESAMRSLLGDADRVFKAA
jgi:UDP-glucose 4-epimerase